MPKKSKYFHYFSIVLIISSSFTLLSLISYLSNWKYDQDQILFFNNLWDYFSSDTIAQNLGGRLGAVVAHILVYQWIGIYSFLIVGYTLYYSIRRYSGKKTRYLSPIFYSLLLFVLFASPLTSFLTPDDGFSWGGGYGRALSGFLTKFLGSWGSGIVLIGAFLMYLYSFDIKVLPVIKIPGLSLPEGSGLKNFLRRIKEPTFFTPAMAGAEAEATPKDVQNANESAQKIQQEEAATDNSDISPDISEMDQQMPDWIKLASDEEEIAPTATVNPKPIPEAESLDIQTQNTSNQSSRNTKHIEPQVEEIIEGIHFESPSTGGSQDMDAGINFEEPDFTDIEIKVAPEEKELEAEELQSTTGAENPNLPYNPKADLSRYKYPELDLLEVYKSGQVALDKEAIKANIELITTTLENFNILINKQKTTATVGPTVTLYEIVPDKGVRISKIRNLEDDIALNLAALGIRIIAPIPGKGTIGIEVPNENRQMVGLRSILASEKFAQSNHQLPLALGKRIDNQNVVIDLAAMPHLLVAGATGQGKSVGINTILVSLLYKLHPSQVKFVLIDPKKVELSVYKLIEKHFLAKLPDEEESIITDTKKVVNTLNSLCIEMDHRYDLLKSAGARNLKEYNAKFISRKLNPKNGHKFLPMIVLVIDEFADLIMTAGKEVENPIARLAQLARAVGIHLIVATQRPDTKVITGTIKANFPARIAFKVSSQFDSRTILDSKGAEQLIGKGDMLLSAGGEVSRIQCAFVDTHEVERIVEFIEGQQGYPTVHELPEYVPESEEFSGNMEDALQKRDKLFEDCARMVVDTAKGSTSMLQRKFNLGYNRAGRIMDQLEAAGIVGPSTGGKAREVHVNSEMDLDQILSNLP